MNMHLTNSDTIKVAEPKTAEEVLALARNKTNLWSAMHPKQRDALEKENKALRMRVAQMERQIDQLTKENMRLGQEVWRLTVCELPERKRAVDIIKEVLLNYPEFTFDDIVSMRQTSSLSVARHTCMYEVYKQRPDLSFPEMGRVFKRDHTTVLAAVRKMARKDKMAGIRSVP